MEDSRVLEHQTMREGSNRNNSNKKDEKEGTKERHWNRGQLNAWVVGNQERKGWRRDEYNTIFGHKRKEKSMKKHDIQLYVY